MKKATKHIITVLMDCPGGSIRHRDEMSDDYRAVEAWCVGGKDGIFAIFTHPDNPVITCYAQGDDGFWWFAGRHHQAWDAEILDAITQYTKE